MQKLFALLLTFFVFAQSSCFAQLGSATIPNGFPVTLAGGSGDSTANYLILGPYSGSLLQNYRKFAVGTGLTTSDGGSQNYFTIGLSSPLQYLSGTGVSSQSTAATAFLPTATTNGTMVYWNGSAWVILAPGTNGYVLQSVSGVPTWSAAGSGASAAATYLTTTNQVGSLPNSSVMTAGTGIQITNGTNTQTHSVDSTVLTTTSTQTGITNKNFTLPVFGWNAGAGNYQLLGSTYAATVKGSDWTAARTLTIPDPGANASFVLTAGATTFTQICTFSLAPVLSTGTLTVGAFTVTVPGATDTLVNLSSAQTLTNKTLSSPTFNNSSTAFTLNKGTYNYLFTAATPAATRTYNFPDVGGNADHAMAVSGTTYTPGGVAFGSSTGIAIGAAGTAGQFLMSNGTSAPSWSSAGAPPVPCGGALYLTSNQPYADGSSSGNYQVIFGPKTSSVLNIGGTNQSFSQTFLTIASSAVAGTAYTLYVTSASSTSVTLAQSAWTTPTTPPTTYLYQGQYYLDSAYTELIVGGYYCAVVGSVYENKSIGRCHLDNLYNTQTHQASATDTATTSTITSTSFVAIDSNTNDGVGRVSWFTFLPKAVMVDAHQCAANSLVGYSFFGLGFDSTTSADIKGLAVSSTAGYISNITVHDSSNTLQGYHYCQRLGAAQAGTTTFYGGTGAMATAGPSTGNNNYMTLQVEQ